MSLMLSWTTGLALIVIPVLALRRLGAGWRWFGMGVLSWVVAVIAKTLLTGALETVTKDSWCLAARAFASGMVSAGTELGTTAWVLRRRRLPWSDVMALGAGIGSFEVLFCLGLGLLESWDESPGSPAKWVTFVDAGFLAERVLAMAGHISSRVLVYAALSRRRWLPAIIAICLFAAVDGTGAYGIAAGWDWNSSKIMDRFLIFTAAVCTLEIAAAWRFGKGSFAPDPIAAASLPA